MNCFVYIVLLEVQRRIEQIMSLYNMETFDLLKVVISIETLNLLWEHPKCSYPPMALGDKRGRYKAELANTVAIVC